MNKFPSIQTTPRPFCPHCGDSGEGLYCGLQDQLFGVSGEWNLVRCQNPVCGLVWLNPEPLETEIYKAYLEYYTHDVETQKKSPIRRLRSFGLQILYKASIISGGLSRQWEDLENMHLNGAPPGRLLDVGCGSGEFLHKMKKVGWIVEGLDFDEDAILKAINTYGVDARTGRLEDMAYEAEVFDAITMSHVIEHIFDTAGLLSEIRRILKPGGRLIAVTPNIDSWGHKRFRQHWRGLEPPRHVRLFNLRALANAATEAGYRHVRVYSTAAGSWSMFAASHGLESGTDKNAYALPKRQLIVLKSLVMQTQEAWANMARGDVGEVCVLVAEK